MLKRRNPRFGRPRIAQQINKTAGIESFEYSPDGESANAANSRFGYTGQVWLAELGLYYYKSRMYSPKLGRFLQPDAIGYAGGMNLYAYVGGDPINRIDPLGFQEEPMEEIVGLPKSRGADSTTRSSAICSS